MGVDSNYNIDNQGKIEYGFDSSKVNTKRSADKHLKGEWVKNVSKSYKTVKRNSSVKIYDATLNGKLNVFKKVEYEKLFTKH